MQGCEVHVKMPSQRGKAAQRKSICSKSGRKSDTGNRESSHFLKIKEVVHISFHFYNLALSPTVTQSQQVNKIRRCYSFTPGGLWSCRGQTKPHQTFSVTEVPMGLLYKEMGASLSIRLAMQ